MGDFLVRHETLALFLVVLAEQSGPREHPAVLEQQEATERLVAILRRANGHLSARLDLDFAETAARAGGACCAS